MASLVVSEGSVMGCVCFGVETVYCSFARTERTARNAPSGGAAKVAACQDPLRGSGTFHAFASALLGGSNALDTAAIFTCTSTGKVWFAASAASFLRALQIRARRYPVRGMLRESFEKASLQSE